MEMNRLLVVRRGCPFCLLALKAVLYVNRYLPFDKRIEVIDNYQWEEMKINSHPVLDEMLDKELFDGYPHIFIDGTVVEPAPTENLIISIAKIVQNDLVMDINFGGRTISPEIE